MTTMTTELTEAEQAKLLQRIDWTAFNVWQSVRFRAGKGATCWLRTVARQLGLDCQVQRAGIDVIFVKVWCPE